MARGTTCCIWEVEYIGWDVDDSTAANTGTKSDAGTICDAGTRYEVEGEAGTMRDDAGGEYGAKTALEPFWDSSGRLGNAVTRGGSKSNGSATGTRGSDVKIARGAVCCNWERGYVDWGSDDSTDGTADLELDTGAGCDAGT
jgi:hypothetical protein